MWSPVSLNVILMEHILLKNKKYVGIWGEFWRFLENSLFFPWANQIPNIQIEISSYTEQFYLLFCFALNCQTPGQLMVIILMASAKPTFFFLHPPFGGVKSRAAELSNQTGGSSASLWWAPMKKTMQLVVYFLCQLTHQRKLKLFQWANLINVKDCLPVMQCVKIRNSFFFCQLFNSTFCIPGQTQEEEKY